MLQRGLAVLLSVCMLSGGISDTAYAMNPQSEVGTVSAVQNVLNKGEVSEFSTEDAVSDPAAEDEEKPQEDQAEDRDSSENSGDGAEADAAGSETSDDGDDDAGQSGMEADENTSESEDGSDSDAAVSEDEANAEDRSEIETDDVVDESEAGVSVQSIREEVLTLTTGAPQEVTLAEEEKQWLYFTAPQDGLFRFYSSTEDGSYQSKYLYLFHKKSDTESDYFDYARANSLNGNFNCTYLMQANETVYLLVEFDTSNARGTFAVNAEKVEAPELTVTKNDEGNYTLLSDSYRLNVVMTPAYRIVKTALELQSADGTALTGSSEYKVNYKYSYDSSYGSKSSSDATIYLTSPKYQDAAESSSIASGGEFLITELQIRDSSDTILAMLGAGGQEISVHTIATDKQGVLTSVTAEDTNITVEAEMISNHDGRLRYRKSKTDETEWLYSKKIVDYYDSPNKITIPAEPDTDYVVELTATDMETVYDTKEIRTKAFAASEIEVEVIDITSSSATIKVTVGAYTGNNRYICARVSYTDSMGDLQTSKGYLNTADIASGSIKLSFSNLAAGTAYKDLEVELDDTDSTSMEYVAYRTKVSFTTAASALTAEQINVTATPDVEDGTKAELKVELSGVAEGSYAYTAKYRIAGSKDWQGSLSKSGTLTSSADYTDRQNLTALVGDTEYEVMVVVDGISSGVTAFKTVAAAISAAVEVKPLMQGVQVTAALTGAETLSGTYTISVQHYNQGTRLWKSASSTGYSDSRLTSNNDWESTAVFYSNSIRPNAENDWKISISDGSSNKVYEKYFTLKAVSQEISLTAERIMCTNAQIKAVLSERDESIRYNAADLYYRAKGATQWINGGSCSYSHLNGDTVYLDGLKEDKEYEVKLIPGDYPEDILAQITFRTLKDTRSLSVSVNNCRYTSAQVNWTFDAGANVLNSSSDIYIYYREKGDAEWNLADYESERTTCTRKIILENLEVGTSYEVLVELKDDYSTIAGQNVVRDVKTEFTTLAIDHELKAEPVENEANATSVTFDMQLTKKTGALENREKVVVTLESVGGSMQSKTVYLNKESQYKAKVKVRDLLPNTKYAVSAKLYESENNKWIWMKNFALGEVTTKKAKAPTSLTISETELFLNKGTSKKLTVTAQPQEAAVNLTWASSDKTVATVDIDGTVRVRKAGEADITVSAASAVDGGSEKLSKTCHVTVTDYVIRVKNENESYDRIPSLLSKSQKRTLVVYDNTEEKDLTGVTWSSSNPNAARISDAGLLEPQNCGQAFITAKTEEGIILQDSIKVVNEIQGFSITRPEGDNDSYQAIRTAEAAYQVAAGETYRVGCVLSPAYTNQYDSTVSMSGDRFTWSVDNDAITVKVSEYNKDWTEITIPESVSGSVKISAVMNDKEYKDKSFTITLDVLKKPEVERLPVTYAWLDYSNKLKDVGLPENWQWKEPGTLIYWAGVRQFTARYVQSGYYPYETGVGVYTDASWNTLSVMGGNYSTGKQAYIIKKDEPLKVKIGALGGVTNTLLYEQSPLTPAAKDAAKVSVTAPDETGYCSVTASAKGTYTVSTIVSLKKAAFEKQDGAYVLTAGETVKNTTASVKFMAVDSAPISGITFAVADDSPEKVTLTGDGTIEYEITAVNADTKSNQRVIYLDVTAWAAGEKVENPNINYAVSDAAVVKLKKEGTGRLVLTIPKGADGLAKIVATAKDDLGYSAQFAVRVKDYTPRVTTGKVTINENYTSSKELAQVVLPYLEENDDWINEPALVETNNQGGKDKVAGLKVTATSMSDSYQYRIWLRIEDKAKIKKKGNQKYYLAIASNAYRGTVFVPVQIKIETGLPAVSLKQSNKVNVFYTDTTKLSSDDYDAVSMGLVDVSSTASIESVRWVAGDGNEAAANTEFEIDRSVSENVWKNGKYTGKYMIRQRKPVLNRNKKPSNAAVKGYLYVCLSGYKEEVKLPFTIQTVYKKPKLKVADYKVCPALGEMTDSREIYTNAAKTDNNLLSGRFNLVWRGYSDVLCADEEIQIVDNSSTVGLRYNGTKDKKTQLTFYSDYWYEALTVPVKVKVVRPKVKPYRATVTLNTAYPSETTRTTVATRFCNAATGAYVAIDDIRIEGANAKAQALLDDSLLNLYIEYDAGGPYLGISVNYAKAMGKNQVKPGSYKYKLTPYCGDDTVLNSGTLTVKIINKEATVKVKAKGAIDLLKLNRNGNDYDYNTNNFVTVTPTFKNLDSSYNVINAKLEGAYKDLFRISRYSDGSLRIIPGSLRSLKAGKSYPLSVIYTVADDYSVGGETITVTSNTFTIKPKQSVPKVTASAKQLTLYACAKGESKAETMYLYVPHESKKGYYAIEDASGSLDVNKDGKADLIVETSSISKYSGRATIAVYVLDADAVKATAKGVAYKIPVTVRCIGRDGVGKDASTTMSVVVKK